MKKVRTILIILLIVLAAGGGFFFWRLRTQSKTVTQWQTAIVTRGDLTATIGATGTVRARQTAILAWQITGTVETIAVRPGDVVKKGDRLASLAEDSLPQSVMSAKTELINARRALDELLNSQTPRYQAEVALYQAQAALDKAQSRYDFLEDVYGADSDELSLLTARAELALAQARLEDARRAYERVKDGPNPDDVRAAQMRVQMAEATLKLVEITAPFAATVTEVHPLPGDLVAPGTLAFRLDDLSSLLVDVQVTEVDINSVRLAQPVTLTFDAILGREYHGKVVQIARTGANVGGSVYFTVTVELDDADEQVKPGMTSSVTVVVNELKDVLLVPNRAVRLVEGRRVVYVLRENQVEQVEIVLGASSDTVSEVIGGNLHWGDTIILNPSLQLMSGNGRPSFIGP